MIGRMNLDWGRSGDRRQAYNVSKNNAALLHEWLANPANIGEPFGSQFGLNFSPSLSPGALDGFNRGADGRPLFEVHSVRPARRVTPDGDIKTDVIVVITQRRQVPRDPANPTAGTFTFRGGCTLVIDPANGAEPIRYSVVKSIWSEKRMDWQRQFENSQLGLTLRSLYFADGDRTDEKEPFALVHLRN